MAGHVENGSGGLVRHALEEVRASLANIAPDAEPAAKELRRVALRLSFAASLLADRPAVAEAPEPLPDAWARLREERQIATILNVVGGHFGFSRAQLRGYGRRAALLDARRVAMYLAWRLVGIGPAGLGRVFDRDFTKSLHALQKVERRRRDDAAFADQLAALREKILDAAVEA